MASKRILIIQLFSNGDCLYATTIAKQIKNDYPQCHLTWAIGSAFKNIISNNPYVDETWEISIPDPSKYESVFIDVIAQARNKKRSGQLDEIFVTQILGDNFSKYDGCVRSSIYRCYGKPITVNKTPVLEFTDEEIQNAKRFAELNNFATFKNIILFECAPQSGQVNINESFIKEFAGNIIKNDGTCVILSSAKKISVQAPNVFDGSVLSIRETGALSHYCSLLIGCSSGITWVTYSSGSKKLPTLQLLNKDAYIYNPPSIAFDRIGEHCDSIIEMFDFDIKKVTNCISVILQKDFFLAKQLYNQKAKKQFRIYRGITYTFLVRRKFSLLWNFIKLNISVHGWNLEMLWMICKGFLFFPLQFIVSKTKKR